MYKFISVISLFLLVSCSEGDGVPNPHDYVCNQKQLEMVTKEYTLCRGSNYLASYCFAQAKATICTPKEEVKNKDCPSREPYNVNMLECDRPPQSPEERLEKAYEAAKEYLKRGEI